MTMHAWAERVVHVELLSDDSEIALTARRFVEQRVERHRAASLAGTDRETVLTSSVYDVLVLVAWLGTFALVGWWL